MSICSVPLVGGLCDAATDSATTLVSAALDGSAKIAGQSASVLFTTMWTVFESTTAVDVTSGYFTSVYDLVFGIAVFVMLAFFLLQVITGMVRREPAALTRAAVGLGKSVLGSFAVLAVVAGALEITDQLTVGIVAATGTTMTELGGRIGALVGGIGVATLTAPGVGAVIALFVAALAIGAAFIIWISLLVRKALLLIAIVFAPLAMAGATWDATRGWISRWATFVLALILSKLVVVVFLLLAVTQETAPVDADLKSVSDPLSGVVLMLIAGFAPYLTYKAISFVGVDFHHAMSTEQEAKQALNRSVPLPHRSPRAAPSSVLREPATTPTSSRGPAAGGSPSAGSTVPSGGRGGAPGPTPVGATAGGTGSGGAGSGGGAAGAGAAGGGGAAAGAGGAAAAGVLVAQKAWSAGQRTGQAVAGAAEQQHDATQEGRS